MDHSHISRRLWWWSLAGMTALLLLPLGMVEIPPLLDYPNHLAGMYVLAKGDSDPGLARMFKAHWTIIPDIAAELVIVPLLRFVPIFIAGKLILTAMLLLPLAGILAYARASFGRVSYWQLGGGLVLYHALFLMGFLNFSLSIGLALLLAAAWTAWRESRPLASIALATLSTAVLFFFHIFGVAFYLVLIGSQELSRLLDTWRQDRSRLGRAFLERALSLALPTVVPLALSLLSPLAQSRSTTRWGVWPRKFSHLFLPFLNYDWHLDWAMALSTLAVGGFLSYRRQLEIARPALIALTVLMAIYFVCPRDMLDAEFIADRWPIMMGLLLFAGASTRRLPASSGRWLVAFLAVLFCVKIGVLIAVWRQSPADIAQIRQVIATVPPGAKVLVVIADEVDNPGYWRSMPSSRKISGFERTLTHAPALLTIERHAFWPDIFASPSKQPLRIRPPYDEIFDNQSYPLTLDQLDRAPDAKTLREHPYLPHWQEKFDYLLLMLPGSRPDETTLMADRLTYVDGTDFAALYAVRHPPAGTP